MKLILIGMAFLCIFTCCSSRDIKDRYRKKKIYSTELIIGSEVCIPFVMFKSDKQSQGLVLHPVNWNSKKTLDKVRANISVINTGAIAMDMDVLCYPQPSYRQKLMPGEERTLVANGWLNGLMISDVTGTPTGIVKIKTLVAEPGIPWVILFKSIGNGGM